MNKSWSNYYATISDRCPWSYYAYASGKSLHIPFRSYDKIRENEDIIIPVKLWSIVYERVTDTVDQLDLWCEENTNSLFRYYFSHPDHSPTGSAAPVPVIIQQRQDILEMARKGVFASLFSDEQGINQGVNVDRLIEKYRTTGRISEGSGKYTR